MLSPIIELHPYSHDNNYAWHCIVLSLIQRHAYTVSAHLLIFQYQCSLNAERERDIIQCSLSIAPSGNFHYSLCMIWIRSDYLPLAGAHRKSKTLISAHAFNQRYAGWRPFPYAYVRNAPLTHNMHAIHMKFNDSKVAFQIMVGLLKHYCLYYS